MKNTFEQELIGRQERAIAPSIFIGVGGVGCKILKRLAEIADEETNAAKYVSFVAMDTDVNDLRKIKAENKRIVTIQTSARKTIGEYLECDSNAKENWFPINKILLKKTPTEGAGQIRAISNLVAHTATREGQLIELNNAIDDLFPLTEDGMQQSIRVTIIGSICGGTGSGLILPIALYVKNYLEQSRQQKSAVVRGFFVLPDVMDSVVTKNPERENLYSNAYASLREIDAFMRLPFDEDLQERYPELKVLMPKVGGGGYDEFKDSPFNFCFLFNKLDSKTTSINDHKALLAHAAECIYNMTISPITGKVNSQEDNIIREITKSKNSASYAGAGSSKVVYPFDSVVDYVALNWAKQTISKQWLEADKVVVQQKLESSKSMFADELNENVLYMRHVMTQANADDAFYKGLVDQCMYMESKYDEPKALATKFAGDLALYTESIRMENDKHSEANKEIKKAWKHSQDSISEDQISHSEQNEKREEKEKLANKAAERFIQFKDQVIRSAKMQVGQITSTIIGADYDPEVEKATPIIQKYMYRNKDQFMHPNAARYFLISVSEELKRQISQFMFDFKAAEDRLNKGTKDLQGYLADKVEKTKENFIDKLKADQEEPYSPSERSENINKTLKELIISGKKRSILDEYCYNLVNLAVFEKVNNYIKGLISGYKEFYTKIESKLTNLDTEIKRIEESFNGKNGSPVAYVCASQICLKKTLSHCKNTIGAFDLPVDLTASIFRKAKKYATMVADGSFADEYGIDEDSSVGDRAKAMDAFFGNVFEEVIMDFWRSAVLHNYKPDLDIDVISAIYKEAKYAENCRDFQAKNAYLASKIEGAVNLTVPFIDSVPGTQDRTISIVAVNSFVMKKCLNEQEKVALTNIIDAEQFALIDSPEISKYQLRLYQSIYNLTARNLSKMKCTSNTSGDNTTARFKNCGTYFRTYHERISGIEPLDKDNVEITPHIEKTWQYINVLPEIDEDFQKREEIRIAKAFIYALVSGKIAYRKHDLNGYNFCYEIIDPFVKAPELYVSNGTRCDQFYEVLDAFTLCPRYVDRLLQLMDKDIVFEKQLGSDFVESAFAKDQATGIVIDEFSLDKKLNIFYIPLLYKVSAASNYIEAWGEALTQAIFEMIDTYVNKLEAKKAVSDIKCEFLIKLYKDYHKNMDDLIALKDGDPNAVIKRKHSRLERLKNDTLTLRIYDLIAEVLREEDAKNPHVGQYTDLIKEISAARKRLGN